MMKKRLATVIILAVFGVGSVFAGGGRAQAERQENVFRIGITTDITSLDPAFSYDPATGIVNRQIVERLLSYNERDELVPHLAESWRAVDSTTYVYTIRKDVKFSDGTPVTIDDVVFSLQRIGDPDVGAYMAWYYDPVLSINKTGDWEVTVKLKSPSSSWPYVFATTGGIISKSYYEQHKSNFGTAAGKILATGPYEFDRWTSGQEIVLKKNQNYWNPEDAAEVDSLVFKVITESTTLVTALQTGEVDFSSAPPQDMIGQLRNNSSLKIFEYQGFGVVFLAFNNQRAPFTDVNVRKAIYHSIDIQSLKNNIIRDAGAAGTVLPQSDSLYGNYAEEWRNYLSRAPVYEYNLTKAKEYLAKSSVPNGFTAKLLTNNSSLRTAIAQVIQNAVAQIGIKLDVVEVTDDEHTAYQFGDFLDKDGNRDFDTILAGWWADFPDVANNLEPLYLANQSTNTAVYNNSRVNSLITQQAQSTDERERNRLIFQALDIIIDEVPYIFVQYPSQYVVLNNRFTGINITTSVSGGNISFSKIRKVQ
jgi:peptide/nickel transport system substrate-binding protein